MEKYKPGYLGKVIPANDSEKMTDFVTNKYDSFSKVYDMCKDHSDNIKDIKPVDNKSNDNPSSLSVKVSTDSETLKTISENASNDETITVENDVLTAKTE